MRIRNAIFAIVLAACSNPVSPTHSVDYDPYAAPADFGARYLGAKYVNDPLGEGAGYDADPLIRTDAFDCLTFVETVLACGDVERLNKIRYAGGDISFENRNHFFTADWLRNNSGLVENVSGDFGDTAMRLGTVTRADWFRAMHGMDIDAAPTDVDLRYVPYSKLNVFDVSEPVLVAFVVNNPETSHRIHSDILVGHVGFLMPGGVLRHASSAAGRVMDTDFKEYTASRARTKTNLGVAFFKIKEFCR